MAPTLPDDLIRTILGLYVDVNTVRKCEQPKFTYLTHFLMLSSLQLMLQVLFHILGQSASRMVLHSILGYGLPRPQLFIQIS
jgi:hypothetical protein